MALKHAKTVSIADPTQADLDIQISLGNYPVGTKLANISLGSDWNNSHVLDSAGLTFAQNAAPTYVRGSLVYDTVNESLTFNNVSTAVSWQIGRENLKRCWNATGTAIPNGSAVYINGFDATSGLQTIALARADSAATMVDVAVTTEAIGIAASGEVTTLGQVNGLNTSTFSSGAIVYVSATTAGLLTTTVPIGIVYRVGTIGRVNATTGYIYVTPSSSSAPGGSTTQVQYNDGGALAGDGNFTWDKTNKILAVSGIINGLGGLGLSIREVTAAGTITSSISDVTIVVNKTTGAATAVTLTTPTYNQVMMIKDGKGDAATNNITITPASGLIDGAASYVINTNKANIMLQYNTATATWWIV